MKSIYNFWGKVISGKKRGKKLGYPTANIALHKSIPEGIYVSKIKLDKILYAAVTFIGKSITFGEKDYKAETYILNFNKNIYDKWVSVFLFKKIRENKRFSSEKELIKQIKQDVDEVKNLK